jgi:hypothetical protein
MSTTNKIVCPNCSTIIDIDEIYSKEIEAKLTSKFQKELDNKNKKIQELQSLKDELNKLKREKENFIKQAKLQVQKELEKEKKQLQISIEKMAFEKLQKYQEVQELKLKEKEEQLAQLKKSLENARRKAEQGSMQIQGEVLELEIEKWLEAKFPFDSIYEVKKGAFGADCIQTINTRDMKNCGTICYESKNTKAWNNKWIAKLKNDMLLAKADLGVLITSVYPEKMDRMGFVDGIWVCSLSEFKGVVSLLRESLIRIHKVVLNEENKLDKMNLLYKYLTSNEFQMQLNNIVNGFIQMQKELDKEKRSLMASWKRRQKIIDGVLDSTTQMYGSLQGIAGNSSIIHIEALELE